MAKSEAAAEKEEYKNDRVHVVVKRKPHCVVEYEVTADRAICIESQDKAVRDLGKDVQIPGFRKGKAPMEIVAKRNPEELDKKWQEGIANLSFKEAASLANVPLVRQDASITFKMQSHTREGAKLTLSFETVPSIPKIDPSKCILKEVAKEAITKEKVAETIRQSQMFFATWKEVHHPIKTGDFVLLDVDVIEEEPANRLFSNTRFEVTDKSMAQWMKKLVLGQKKGAVVEGVSTPDESASEEEKADYPPKKVRITIKAVEEATLPPLDDAFAKQLGVETMEQLHERIDELLNKKADEAVRDQQREQVTAFLLSHPFEIPFSVVEKEIRFRMEQMIKDASFKRQWDMSSDKQKHEMIDTIKGQAEKAIRIFYLCRTIASQQNITLSQKDITQASSSPLEALLYPSDQIHDASQPDIKQAEAYSRALLERAEDWVIAHARVETPSLAE